MRFSIISEIPGRTRLQLAGPVPESDLDALLKLSGDIDGVHKVRVYGRIGQMALEYDEPRRASVLDALGALDAQAIADAKSGYVMQLEPRKHKLVMDLATLVGARVAPARYLRVAAPALVFLAVSCLSLAFSVNVDASSAASFDLAPSGWRQIAEVGARSLGALAALLFLVLTTPLVDLIALLRRLHFPEALLEIMVLCYRMLFVFSEALHDTRTAQAARLGYATPALTLRSWPSISQ